MSSPCSWCCSQQLQEDINLQNMDLLTSYFEKYEKLISTLSCELVTQLIHVMYACSMLYQLYIIF